MPNNTNERKGKQAGELSAEERFRNFFSTSVIDLPEEMTRRDEPAPVEEKPKAGLLGKLFSHDKEETPAPAQPVLEIPTGEILLGADAKPVQPEQEDMALERELLLLKLAADVHNRSELREIASIYKAKIIDLSPDSMVLELTGRPEKVDAFLKILADYKILEQCRTGVTALERGGMHQHMQKPPQEVRAAQLPLPGTHCPQ